jgi:hypothetical protein
MKKIENRDQILQFCAILISEKLKRTVSSDLNAGQLLSRTPVIRLLPISLTLGKLKISIFANFNKNFKWDLIGS